jgi:hypothetical protein
MLPSIITGLLLLTRKNYKPIEQSPDKDANSKDSENKEFLVVQPDTGNDCPYRNTQTYTKETKRGNIRPESLT